MTVIVSGIHKVYIILNDRETIWTATVTEQNTKMEIFRSKVHIRVLGKIKSFQGKIDKSHFV